jgi:hypothetical protein
MFQKLKPFLVTGLVAIVAVELWSSYIRPLLFPAPVAAK